MALYIFDEVMGDSKVEFPSEDVFKEQSMVSQTPVLLYRDVPEVPGAPKKYLMYMCRTQIPPSGPLHEEWPLDSWVVGAWGYIFHYERGELWFYQLDEGEELGPATMMSVLSVEDWCVLKTLLKMAVTENDSVEDTDDAEEEEDDEMDEGVGDSEEDKQEKKDEEEVEQEVEEKKEEVKEVKEEKEEVKEEEKEERDDCPLRGKRFRMNASVVLSKMETLAGVSWQSKDSTTGRWLSQATVRCFPEEEGEKKKKKSADLFVLERLNPDCGLLRGELIIPALDWFDRMTEISERITTFFRECCCWKEKMIVRKALDFE